jgi:hypothetical protein
LKSLRDSLPETLHENVSPPTHSATMLDAAVLIVDDAPHIVCTDVVVQIAESPGSPKICFPVFGSAGDAPHAPVRRRSSSASSHEGKYRPTTLTFDSPAAVQALRRRLDWEACDVHSDAPSQ